MVCKLTHHCCCHQEAPTVNTALPIPKKKKKSPSNLRRDANRKLKFLQKKHGHIPNINVNVATPINEDATRELRSTLQQKDDQISKLQITVSQLQTQLNHAKSHIEELKHCEEENEKLRQNLSSCDTNINVLNLQQQESQDTIEDLQSELEELKSDLINQGDIQPLLQSITELEGTKHCDQRIRQIMYDEMRPEFAKYIANLNIWNSDHSYSVNRQPCFILDCVIDKPDTGKQVRYFLVDYSCNCPPLWERERPELDHLIRQFYKNAHSTFHNTKRYCKEFPQKH